MVMLLILPMRVDQYIYIDHIHEPYGSDSSATIKSYKAWGEVSIFLLSLGE